MTPGRTCGSCGKDQSGQSGPTSFCEHCGAELLARRSSDFDNTISAMESELGSAMDALDAEVSSLGAELGCSPAESTAAPDAPVKSEAVRVDAGPDIVTNHVSHEKVMCPEIHSVTISQTALNSFVTTTMEVMPSETIGVMFGAWSGGNFRVDHVQSLQTVLSRDAVSVAPSLMSRERILRIMEELDGASFGGSYHSHPYFSPTLLGGNQMMGLGMSDADKKAIIVINDAAMEVIVAYFPWDIWKLPGGAGPWRVESVNPGGNVTALCKSIEHVVETADLLPDFDEALVNIEKELRELRHHPGRDSILKGAVLELKIREMQALADMIRKEREEVAAIPRISGFDVWIAAHARKGKAVHPVNVSLA